MASTATDAPSLFATQTQTSSPSIFNIPRPLRSLFNHFPLQIYPPNPLPCTATTSFDPSTTTTTTSTASPALYIFASPSSTSSPSPNPTCLKLQTYLRAANIPHTCVSSTNHASPSGALPFLHLPSSSEAGSDSNKIPLTGDKIIDYAKRNANPPTAISEVDSNPKLEAYRSLITQIIRPAWLYDLYLVESNAQLVREIYLPSSSLAHPSLRHTLRSAATSEILQTTRRAVIQPAILHSEAISALRSLDALLSAPEEKDARDGDDCWFFGAAAPSLFDAEVFAYTWLLLDEEGAMRQLHSGLREELRSMRSLARHRTRLYEKCWGQKD